MSQILLLIFYHSLGHEGLCVFVCGILWNTQFKMYT